MIIKGHGEKNRKYFLEFMNRPNRYISRDALSLSSVVSFEELKEFYKDKDWMCDRITTLETHLRILKTMAPYAAINFIRNGMGYEEYLQEYARYRKIKPEELWETLNRIHESARGMKTLEEWMAYMDPVQGFHKLFRFLKDLPVDLLEDHLDGAHFSDPVSQHVGSIDMPASAGGAGNQFPGKCKLIRDFFYLFFLYLCHLTFSFPDSSKKHTVRKQICFILFCCDYFFPFKILVVSGAIISLSDP